MIVSDNAFEAVRARLSMLETAVAVQAKGTESTLYRLGKIENVLSRLTWLMVSGIGGAFIAFVIGGGLAHLPLPVGG